MKDKKVIVMGDFNVAHNPIDTHRPDPRHPSFTKEERSGFNDLLELGFIDYFRYKNKSDIKYTFWNNLG
jgi:exodeoxyribonuclease-3